MSPGAVQRMLRKKKKKTGGDAELPPGVLCVTAAASPASRLPPVQEARRLHAVRSATAHCSQIHAAVAPEEDLGDARSDTPSPGRGASSGGRQWGDKAHSLAGVPGFFIFVFVNINFFSEEKLPMDHPMLAKAVSSPALSGWIDLGHQIGLGGLQLAVAPRLWQSFRSPFGRQVKVPSAGLPSRTEKRMHRNLWPRTSGPEHVSQMQCVMFMFLLYNI